MRTWPEAGFADWGTEQMRMQAASLPGSIGIHRAFAAACLLHVICVLGLGHYRHPVLMENGAIARNLLDGLGFVGAVFHPPPMPVGETTGSMADRAALPRVMQLQPTSNQAPGYPLLLWTFWRILGDNPGSLLLLSLCQALIVSTIVYPVSWLTTRWFGPPAALLAAWLAAILPPYAFFVTRFSSASVSIACYPWLVAGWLSLTHEGTWRRTLLVSIATGGAVLFDPVMLGVFGLVGLVLLARAVRQGERTAIQRLVFAALVVVVILLPWTVRNYRVHGRLVLVKNSFGKELWIGNNPQSTGSSVLPDGRTSVFSLYLPTALQLPANVTEMDVMRHMQAEAVAFIRRDPAAFLWRTAQKILWFWTWLPARAVSADSARLEFRGLQQLYWGLLLALAAASLRRLPRDYVVLLGIIAVVYSTTYGLTFVEHSRFRVGVEFVLIPAAAASLAWLWHQWAGGRRSPVTTPAGAAH